MMEIKNFLMMNNNFMPAFERLLKKEITAKSCLQLSTAYDEIVTQITVIDRTRQAIAHRYAKRTEDGSISLDAENAIEFDNEDSRLKALCQIDEILNETLEVDLDQVVLKPDECMTTEDFILLKYIVKVADR